MPCRVKYILLKNQKLSGSGRSEKSLAEIYLSSVSDIKRMLPIGDD